MDSTPIIKNETEENWKIMWKVSCLGLFTCGNCQYYGPRVIVKILGYFGMIVSLS